MLDRITIRRFGPIQDANIEVRPLTVFVGPQASGKSLAAQVIYFLLGMEDLIEPRIGEQKERDAVLHALRWWLGVDESLYVEPGSFLRRYFPGDGDQFNELRWDETGAAHINEALKDRIYFYYSKIRGHLDIAYRGSSLWEIPPVAGPIEPEYPHQGARQIYIPAGRVLFSYLSPYSRAYLQAGRRWPGYMVLFYETLGKALEKLWRGREELIWRNESLLSEEGRFIKECMESLLLGRLEYEPESVRLNTAGHRLEMTTIASGQMEIWPFWAVIDALVHNIIPPHPWPIRLYFEEPEAHLHPAAQKSIMEIIAYLVNRGDYFLITTHSPYVLYAINNFLMAFKAVGEKSFSALAPERVAAYRFSREGKVYDIFDREVGLIDESELDDVAADLGEEFTLYQEKLEYA